MKIATSYFYQIRNFLPHMIPVSTALSDPAWYRPPTGKEYYIDKKGIVCGLRYEPLIVQGKGTHSCPCESPKGALLCETMNEYWFLLNQLVDFDKMIKDFHTCAYKMANKYLFEKEPIIVLMVYEAPNNLCSERIILQNYFNSHGWNCKELEYPIIKGE